MVKKIWNLFKAALDGKVYDYTQGSLNKAIFLLAIPMILELSLESIFAVVDIFFVGKLGPNAIAAVGFTESILTLIYSVAIGLSTAASAIIARRVGEKNIDDAKYTATQSLIFSIVISIFISILGVVYSSHLLKFMGASNEVILQGSIFTKIMFGGNLSILLLFLINGIFRGAGNAAIAMKSLWISSIINIILVPTLVYGIGPWNGLGLMGAAIATNIGRSAGVIYQLYYLFSGSSIISLDIRKFYPDFSEIKKLIQLAWPATFQFIIASGSWIILAKLISEEGGTNVSAGYQIAIRNVVFFILPAWGLSNAAATLIGQNMGAGNFERAEKSVLITMKYNIIFMCFRNFDFYISI
jgi:putative MATE family efflux protein